MSSNNNINTNTIIFTMARMNPPTPGHLSLIKTLIEQAIDLNVNRVFIILSKTNDNSDDPIPCDKNPDDLGVSFKIEIINYMVKKLKSQMINNVKTETYNEEIKNQIISKINNIDVICRCVPIVSKQAGVRQPTPFTPLSNIINDDFKDIKNLNLIMVIGDDRASLLDNVADAFYKKLDTIHSINGIIMIREGMSEYKNLSPSELENLNIETVPINAFSASFVRKLVKNGLKDKFEDVYKPYLDQEQIDVLYDSILKGLLLKEPKSKGDDKVEIPKYVYPLIKNGGSKKRNFKTKSYTRRNKKSYKRKNRKITNKNKNRK
jgi:nicotinic acid mononucleotide adenylyltransferase